MFRSIARLLISILFTILITSTVNAEFRFRDGTELEIQWYEQAGVILNKDVCFNYKNDKRKFKQCRKKAVDYFKEECDFYTDKIKNTPRKYRKIYIPEQEKFCNAFESYEP